jgi:hypothetical protein
MLIKRNSAAEMKSVKSRYMELKPAISPLQQQPKFKISPAPILTSSSQRLAPNPLIRNKSSPSLAPPLSDTGSQARPLKPVFALSTRFYRSRKPHEQETEANKQK